MIRASIAGSRPRRVVDAVGAPDEGGELLEEAVARMRLVGGVVGDGALDARAVAGPGLGGAVAGLDEERERRGRGGSTGRRSRPGGRSPSGTRNRCPAGRGTRCRPSARRAARPRRSRRRRGPWKRAFVGAARRTRAQSIPSATASSARPTRAGSRARPRCALVRRFGRQPIHGAIESKPADARVFIVDRRSVSALERPPVPREAAAGDTSPELRAEVGRNHSVSVELSDR